MSEIDNLINDLFEKHKKKHELASSIQFLSFDSLYDLIQCLRNVPEQEQETIQKFNNAYADLYELRSQVLRFVFSTISEMNMQDLKQLESLLEGKF